LVRAKTARNAVTVSIYRYPQRNFDLEMAKKTKKTSIKTQRELAALVERDPAQVCRWLKDDRWTFGKAPWPRAKLPAILKWVADELRNDEGGSELVELKGEKLTQEIRRLTALAGTAEMELDRERGKLIDADAVRAEFENTGRIIRNGFASLTTNLLPIALKLGMPATASNQFSVEAQEQIDSVLSGLSKSETDDAEEPA
jgi:phage terminase Nu1 subunit (DNA packaging protein)